MTNASNHDSFARIEDLKKGKLEVVEHFDLNWENAFLITHYHYLKTFVLLSNCRKNKPLRAVINEFAHRNQCYRRCIDPHYDFIRSTMQERGLTCGYIAGNHRLLPTMGLKNAELVYYMAKPMKHHYYSDHHQGMVLNFEAGEHYLNVIVPTSEKKFEKILAVADQISSYQFDEIHEKMHRYGYDHQCTGMTNHYHMRATLYKKVAQFAEWRYTSLVRKAFINTYGDEPEREFIDNFKKVLFEIKKH